MKHHIISTSVAVVALVVVTALGAEPQTADPVKLTPRPKMVAWEQGKLQLTKATKIMYSGDGAKVVAESLGEKLRPATGYPFAVAGPPPANTAFFGILLELQPKANHLGDAGFMMEVGPGMARIAAATTNGLAKGCSILIQLLPAAILEKKTQENVKWAMPCCKLLDLQDAGQPADESAHISAPNDITAMVREFRGKANPTESDLAAFDEFAKANRGKLLRSLVSLAETAKENNDADVIVGLIAYHDFSVQELDTARRASDKTEEDAYRALIRETENGDVAIRRKDVIRILRQNAERSGDVRIQLDQMKKADGALVAQFKRIKKGMTPAQVREIMGVEPEVMHDNLWHIKLSRASDTPEEIDWKLRVRFENGLVTDTQVTYTCLHRQPSTEK